jgi:hypothetical protein
MNAGKSIGERQVLTGNLERLSAQRRFYSRAKTVRGGSVLIASLLALLSPVVALYWPQASSGISLVAFMWAIIELVLFDGFEERNRHLGALVQEDFDTRVLDLPWNASIGVRPPAEEIVAAGKEGSTAPSLKDWYADVSVLPHGLAVLACQRSCVTWDRRSRGMYKFLLVGVALLLVFGGISLALYREMKLSEFLLTLALPVLPAVQHAIKTFKAHSRAGAAQERLLDELSAAWDTALAGGGGVPVEQLRRVQDQLFQLRREQPPIPDGVYWLLRSQFESTMRSATQRHIEDAAEKLHLSLRS